MSPLKAFARVVAALCGLVAVTAYAGDLNPPPGPIEPTMKPIDVLLPGRCISDLPGSADAVHVISEPGLYVLTGDVVAQAGKSAIAVELNAALPAGEYRVTIDLAGYDVLGVPGADAGIDFRHTTPGHKYIDTLTLRGPLTSRVTGFDGPGIRCVGDADLSVSSVHVSACGGHGIECTGSSRVALSSVRVSECTGDGVHLSSVAQCDLAVTVSLCGGDGIEATQCGRVRTLAVATLLAAAHTCEITTCGGDGIRVSNSDWADLSSCNIDSSGLDGVRIDNCSRVAISSCNIGSSGQDGVRVDLFDECGVASTTIADCVGDGLKVSNGRRLSACCIGSSGEDGVETRIERCNANGVLVSNVTDVELSLRAELCVLDGVHIEDADECRLAVHVADCDGDGIEATNVARLRAGRRDTRGTYTVYRMPLRVTNVLGHGVVVSGGDEADIAASVRQCGLDGVHVQNVVQCSVEGDYTDCAGDGIDASQCARMAIGTKGMPTSSKPKPKGGHHAHRVVNPGGHGVLLTNCAEVVIDDLECSHAVLDGVHLDSSALASSSVSLHAVTVDQCGGDGMESSMGSLSTMDARSCGASACGGDGLHVSGAASVSISDWRDDDCDGDGIEVLSSTVVATHIRVDGALSVSAGDSGVKLYGAVLAALSQLSRVTVEDAANNGIDARNLFQLGSLAVEDCVVTGCGGDAFHAGTSDLTLSKLRCENNVGSGVRVTDALTVVARDVYGNLNGAEGMRVTGGGGGTGKVSMQDFHFTSNGAGIPGGAPGLSIESMSSVTLRNGECSSNSGDGVRLADFDRDGMLDLVVCSSNVGHGVHAESTGGLPLGRCRVTNAMCDNNGGSGVSLEATTGGEVAQCTLSNNAGVGVFVLGNAHVVRSNACVSNLGGAMVVPVPGNVVGPLVDELAVGGNCNPAANYVY